LDFTQFFLLSKIIVLSQPKELGFTRKYKWKFSPVFIDLNIFAVESLL